MSPLQFHYLLFYFHLHKILFLFAGGGGGGDKSYLDDLDEGGDSDDEPIPDLE